MRLQNLTEKIQQVFPENQSKVLQEVLNFMDELVKVSDFNELKLIVKELAEAQKRTDIKIGELVEAQKRTEQKLEELTEAQKRTEQKLEELAEAQKRTEQKLEELVEAQKRTEQKLEELAEAQKRTDIKIGELVEAQKRTEVRFEELADAQRKTEEKLGKLIEEHQTTRQELGGLSHSFGYLLEDRAYKGLPAILEKQWGIKVKEPLKRDIFPYKGDRKIEINIIGKGEKDQKEIWIIGESKSQLKRKHVDQFIRKQYIFEELFPGDKFYLMVTHMTDPEVKAYAEKQGIRVFYSYEFPL
jgi:hypothetical protein